MNNSSESYNCFLCDEKTLLEIQKDEDLLKDDPSRFVILPISEKYADVWKLYKTHEDAFWRAEEIDYTADLQDWEKMPQDEKRFVEYILAFFAGSDGIVIENLLTNFGSEVKVSEVRAFYAFQAMIETTHGLTYARLIETLIDNPKRRNTLFNAIEEIPVVKKKAQWALQWIDPKRAFAIRLLAFAIVEGVFFSGAFCAIYWLKENNKMVKALGHSNELISRDESMHTQCAVMLFKKLGCIPDKDIVRNMFTQAVNLEKEFICDAVPCDLIGMNSSLMGQYIEFVSDRLLSQLGYEKLFKSENPFGFMENLSLDGKTNFFEKYTSEYKLGSHSGVKDSAFDTSGDF